METIEKAIDLLADGRWREIDRVREELGISQKNLFQLIDFLRKYGFIDKESEDKIRLNPELRRLLAPLSSKPIEAPVRDNTLNHMIVLYADRREKHAILFPYLKTGLERGEAVQYIVSQESPEEFKKALRDFGVDVELYEKNDSLRVLNSREWYFKNGKFEASRSIGLMEELYNKKRDAGFKGLIFVGETACFFENKLVKALVEYEQVTHKIYHEPTLIKSLAIPMLAVCAYDRELITRTGGVELLLNLLKAHSTAIIGLR